MSAEAGREAPRLWTFDHVRPGQRLGWFAQRQGDGDERLQFLRKVPQKARDWVLPNGLLLHGRATRERLGADGGGQADDEFPKVKLLI